MSKAERHLRRQEKAEKRRLESGARLEADEAYRTLMANQEAMSRLVPAVLAKMEKSQWEGAEPVGYRDSRSRIGLDRIRRKHGWHLFDYSYHLVDGKVSDSCYLLTDGKVLLNHTYGAFNLRDKRHLKGVGLPFSALTTRAVSALERMLEH